MRYLARVIVLSSLSLFAGSHRLPAQTHSPAIISNGLVSLAINSTAHNYLVSSGITTLYLNYQAPPSGEVVFQVFSGTMDFQTSAGEIWTSGGIEFVRGTTTLSVRDLSIATTPTSQVVSGFVIVNNHQMGRQTIFTTTQGSTFSFLSAGSNTSDTTYFTLDQNFSTLLTTTFQIGAIPPGTVVGAFVAGITANPDPNLP